MYEKNISDWSITKNNKFENGYNLYIGTWSNWHLSLIECLAYLKLASEKLDSFIFMLEERNKKDKYFNEENKIKHIEYIKKFGVNPNAFINFYNLPEVEINERINEESIKEFIDSENTKKEIVKIILSANNIKDLYLAIQGFKTDLQNSIYNNWDSYIIKESE